MFSCAWWWFPRPRAWVLVIELSVLGTCGVSLCSVLRKGRDGPWVRNPTTIEGQLGSVSTDRSWRTMEDTRTSSTDSEDDRPLLDRMRHKNGEKEESCGVDGSLRNRSNPKQTHRTEYTSDSDEDVPLALQMAKRRDMGIKRKRRHENGDATYLGKAIQKKKKANGRPDGKKNPRNQSNGKTRERNTNQGKDVKWNTLEWKGLLFPPEYQPHGVKMLYDGQPVTLTPAQEEVATFFAVMRDTDYVTKPTFIRNFWDGFQNILGSNHIIQKFELCDFTPIYEWHMAEREKKQNRTKEEKKKIREETQEKEEPYKWALVDGRKEQVGNFRIEPPGLFRGRGEHPKMGKLKRRIYPEDVTINIGKGAPIPECNMPGHKWGGIRHDNTVTWLAFWKDPVDSKQFKYVWMAANSTFKADSDRLKYEKARELKKHIRKIRDTYTQNFRSSDRTDRMIATAVYLIDILALRAGHEKDEDEADTVGCCNLKAENVQCLPPCSLKFDFLGKDSIRYENTVEVLPQVYKNVEDFVLVDNEGRRKKPTDQLFEFDVVLLNKWLKAFMDGLSAKVFRTYNASITLDRLLQSSTKSWHVDGKLAEYNAANKEVAVLCNHQRSIPKTHNDQMERMDGKLAKVEEELQALHDEYKDALQNQQSEKKAIDSARVLDKITRKQGQLDKLKLQKKVKEDLKTVALGTSKINYLDPRISIAWCKREEVPVEKVFNKSLLGKFAWAMEANIDFRF